jgi:hypothetical protein
VLSGQLLQMLCDVGVHTLELTYEADYVKSKVDTDIETRPKTCIMKSFLEPSQHCCRGCPSVNLASREQQCLCVQSSAPFVVLVVTCKTGFFLFVLVPLESADCWKQTDCRRSRSVRR